MGLQLLLNFGLGSSAPLFGCYSAFVEETSYLSETDPNYHQNVIITNFRCLQFYIHTYLVINIKQPFFYIEADR